MPLLPFSFMPRRRILTSAFIVGAVVCALPLVAQRADSLTVGAKIRVQRAAPVWTMVRGTYVTRDSVSFVLDESNGSGVRTSIPYIPARAVAGVFSVLLTGVTTLVGGGIGLAARDQWREVAFRP